MDLKPILIFCALAMIYVCEGLFPHFPGRIARAKHAFPHVVTALLNGLLTRLFLTGMTITVMDWAAAREFGLRGVLGISGMARTVLALVLFDLWMYVWHRANHRIAFLWRFHRAHHSDIAMDTTTALRFHPGELILSSCIRLPVLVLINMSFSELVLFEVLLNLSTLFHHSNLAIPRTWDRRLSLVLVTPDMHRVHHSVERQETNSNFTSLLSLWDRLAHTFRTREDTGNIRLGLPLFREEKYQHLAGFLVTPFL